LRLVNETRARAGEARPIMLLALLALSLPTISPPAPVAPWAFMNAHELALHCELPGEDSPGNMVCLAYIAGSLDQMLASQAGTLEAHQQVCPSSTVPLNQFRSDFLDYLVFHPDERTDTAGDVLRRVARISLPCP
jgi:hypothetical protein